MLRITEGIGDAGLARFKVEGRLAGRSVAELEAVCAEAVRVLEADAQDDGGIDIYWDAARLYQESGEKHLAYATMMRCAEYLSRSGATLESCTAFAAAASFAILPRTRYQALSGQLNGLHAMGEFAAAQPVLDEFRALSDEHPEYSLSAEQEVLALEIAHFSGASEDMQAALWRLASNRSLSADVRLHSIRVGLVTADNRHDRQAQLAFSEALEGLRLPPSDVLYLLRAKVVDFTLKGQFEHAYDVADELLIESRRRSNRPAISAGKIPMPSRASRGCFDPNWQLKLPPGKGSQFWILWISGIRKGPGKTSMTRLSIHKKG